MSSFLARTSETKNILHGPHSTVSGSTWQHIKFGTATSAGDAGGTTLVDTGGSSGAARTYNGQYSVKMLTGAATGQTKLIVEDDGAGTLTFENNGFESQIGSGDEYQILKNPRPMLTVTTSTSETAFTCSARTEPTDFWKDFYAMVVYASDNAGSSPPRGEIQKISASTSAGVFTVAAFTQQPRIGDVLAVGHLLDVADLAPGLTEEFHERPGDRVDMEVGDGEIGARGGDYGFSTWIRPSNNLSGAGSPANRSVISSLFQAAALVENIGNSIATANADSTTTVLELAAGSQESYTIGEMLIVNGEACFVTAISDGTGTAAADQVTVTPPLSTAPLIAAVVHGTVGYHKTTDSDVQGVWLEVERDGVRETMTGCKGTVTLQAAGDAAPAVLAWAFSVDHYIRELEARPYNPSSAFSTAPAVLFKDRLAYIDTTKVSVMGVTATPNATVVAKNIQGSSGINGRSGYQHGSVKGAIVWNELLDASLSTLPQEDRFQRRTAGDVMVILGSHGRTFAVRAPVARQIVAPHPLPIDTMLGVPVEWQAQDAGTVLGTSPVTNQKNPSFAFHLA